MRIGYNREILPKERYMSLFFELESAYLVIAAFILLVALFASTRSFIKKGAWKKVMPIVSFVLAVFIGLHFYITYERIKSVETRFESGNPVICESRAVRKVGQSVIVKPDQRWELKEHIFSSPLYDRVFFSARCLEYFEE